MKSINQNTRVFGLDVMRAVAIIMVVIGHGSYMLNDTCIEGFPFIRLIDGVDLFFVLSGFLIGGILLKEINAKEEFDFRSLRQFWKRRWMRTLPLYYLVLLANYLVVRFDFIHEDFSQFNWKFFFFLQNFSKPFAGFFWESWSLSIEEWFYLTSPILLWFLLKFLNPKKTFILVTFIMMISPFLYRIWILNPQIDDFWYDAIFRKMVLTRLDSIAYGLLAAWICFYFPRFWTKWRVLSAILGTVLMVFILHYEASNSGFYQQVIRFSLTPISVMLLVPIAHHFQYASGFVARAITHVSKISYSMYLIHLGLVSAVIRDHFPPTTEIDGLLKYLLYWCVVLVGSTILYRFVEKPMMRLRDKV